MYMLVYDAINATFLYALLYAIDAKNVTEIIPIWNKKMYNWSWVRVAGIHAAFVGQHVELWILYAHGAGTEPLIHMHFKIYSAVCCESIA